MTIYKKPVAAHLLKLHIPDDAVTVMGHTRLTTQGDGRKNRNNHPFLGHAGKLPFAFAHNGVLNNDVMLRKSLKLPKTRIATDSYIGVQLIEQKRTLDFASLAYMAEQVEGVFTFTTLDGKDNLYFVKGENPMCLYHFPQSGVYIYASTEEILLTALDALGIAHSNAEKIPLVCGDILCVDRNGSRSESQFDDSHLWERWYLKQPYSFGGYCGYEQTAMYDEEEAWDDLKSVACYYGYSPDDIDDLRAEGFSFEELEEYVCCGCGEA
ncbi:hypothetical protein LJC34_01930 [Oscillospiraceae bacterium OttesenSCG-928-G22]|nr:hypothetical protein [Oscillospiraceae bacterium OttesenSCG-928-G22]